jgi:lipoate-protein ligase B
MPSALGPRPAPPVWLVDLGRVEYGLASRLQRHLAAERDAERVPDLLLLLEHPPVLTLGRRAGRDHVHASERQLERLGITVHETNRGGLVTYHGPGQIVGYPIARLRPLAGDAPSYVYGLEETIIRTAAELGVAAWREREHRGVFAHGGKIAAIGVAVTYGVTMHGFALNVRPDLGHFALINPCGIEHLGVTSIERHLGRAVDAGRVRRALATHFGAVFDRGVDPAPGSLWEALRTAGFGALERPLGEPALAGP